MPRKLGPFFSAGSVVVHDPADPSRVLNATTGASLAIGSASFNACSLATAQEGTTGVYFATLPTAFDASAEYMLSVYAAGASAFSQATETVVDRPVTTSVSFESEEVSFQ